MSCETLARQVAKRIKVARVLSGLSRKQLCDKYNLNEHTYQSWEQAKVNFSKHNADRLSDLFRKENVICTAEWLLTGLGVQPTNMLEYQKNDEAQNNQLNSFEIIEKEVSTFEQLNKDSITCVIIDDALAPIFKPHDRVGGIITNEEDYNLFFNQPCIVRLPDERVFVRIFTPGNQERKYNLWSSNQQTTAKEPIISNTNVSLVAPIAWWRRLVERK